MQLALTAGVAVAALPFGTDAGKAALLGAAIGLVANGYFAWRIFSAGGVGEMPAGAALVYRAEIGKLLMLVAMFAVAFSLVEGLYVGAALIGYLTVHLGTSFGALMFDRRCAPNR